MKRDDTRRLRLHRETLRVLRDEQLAEVQGAMCEPGEPGRPKTNLWTGVQTEHANCS